MEMIENIESAISQWLSENEHPKETQKCQLSVSDRLCNSEIAIMEVWPKINFANLCSAYQAMKTHPLKYLTAWEN